MEPVDEIFAAFGKGKGKGATRFAREIGESLSTVHSWRKTLRNIPKWRRAKVLQTIQRLGLTLSPAAIEYLQDDGAALSESANAA